MKLRRFISLFTKERCWYVVYPEGPRTVLMDHTHASNLAEIFGGKVIWKPVVRPEAAGMPEQQER